MSSCRLTPPAGLVLAILLAGCAARDPRDWASVREVTPAFLASRAATDPALACDAHGRVALTWVTSDSIGQDLWLALSADSGRTFAAPVRANPRPGSVSSTPESRPLPVFGPGGELLVAWSQRRGADSRIADLVASAGTTAGRALGPPITINDDRGDERPDYHGLAAMTFLPGGTVFAAWIDTREDYRLREASEPDTASEAGASGVASIFYAVSGDGGLIWSDNRSLNGRACPNARPTVLGDAEGTVALAYRAAATPRGPALAISRDRGASFALDSVVVVDGAAQGACAADGPTLSLDGSGGGLYAWRSDSTEGGAWIAPWHAGIGLAGARRSLTDGMSHIEHPRLARFGDATLIAAEGRESPDRERGVVAVRSLAADGALTPWIFLGADASGVWSTAAGGRTALVCWVERAGPDSRVRVVRLTRRGR